MCGQNIYGQFENTGRKSTAKSAYIQCNKIDSLTERIADASSRINDVGRMAVDFSSPDVHVGKIMIEAHGIDFAYPGENGLWEKRLDFIVRSGDRICVTGRNGSGKSTLMKIIKGELAPTIGSVYRADIWDVFIWIRNILLLIIILPYRNRYRILTGIHSLSMSWISALTAFCFLNRHGISHVRCSAVVKKCGCHYAVLWLPMTHRIW